MVATALRKSTPAAGVSDAARELGRHGGRPKGSYSSPLAAWLRREIREKQGEGWGRREGFDIAADTHIREGRDAFVLGEWEADELGIETVDAEGNERLATVTWAYWKKIWLEVQNGNRFP